MNFNDVATVSGLGPTLAGAFPNLQGARLKINQVLPQQVMVSIYHEINEKLAVMANFGWQNWRAFGKIGLEIDAANPVSITIDSNLRGHLSWRLGPALQSDAPAAVVPGLRL